ncbi:MAG: hypothetical protein KBT10_04290 [Bacteroidales bacterium]|nr:hypothetical protein [Candidatus Sodaliphilus aphodohippi]
MKKTILLLACASMMATSAMAQMSVVKEAAKLTGSTKVEDLAKALDIIKPALTNPETAQTADAWFNAGKASFGLYDQLLALKSMNKEYDANVMSSALMDGFNYLQKALPLDSVKETNKDGSFKMDKEGNVKIKTKFSKDIIPLLTGHVNDVAQLGNEALQSEKWEVAAQAYDNYCNIITSPFGRANTVVGDSTIAQVRFFEGYSQYQVKNFADAFNNFSIARSLGYTENQVVQYQTSCLANLVQDMLDKKDYAGAHNFIDNATAKDPTNATLYDIKGFTLELEKGIDEALPYYQKAVETDPNYANGYYDTGRVLYLQGTKVIADHPNDNNRQLADKIRPYFDKALPYLEKAAALDENNTKVKTIIDDINYKYEVMGIKK